jgi:predicted HAD superfamily Cof-like phosphohydrolase
MDWFNDILDFHKIFKQKISKKPEVPDIDTVLLRSDLIKEEYTELHIAIMRDDLINIADGITDLIVVLLGTAISYGIDIRPIWNEIHKTNMAKIGGPIRDDGKILKPTGWKAPEIDRLLKEQKEIE